MTDRGVLLADLPGHTVRISNRRHRYNGRTGSVVEYREREQVAVIRLDNSDSVSTIARLRDLRLADRSGFPDAETPQNAAPVQTPKPARKRPLRARETPEYLDMVHRLIRTAGKRAADGDEPELAALLALYAKLDAAVVVAIDGQRERGASWDAIGRAAGVTRSTAFERFGPKSRLRKG